MAESNSNKIVEIAQTTKESIDLVQSNKTDTVEMPGEPYDQASLLLEQVSGLLDVLYVITADPSCVQSLDKYSLSSSIAAVRGLVVEATELIDAH